MLTGDMMKDAILSDLFFNDERAIEAYHSDISKATTCSLRTQAVDFADSIGKITDGAIVLDPDKLVADFTKRV